jgi:hypothetical protein
MTLGKSRQQLGFFQAGQVAMHDRNHIGRVARRMSYAGKGWCFLRL